MMKALVETYEEEWENLRRSPIPNDPCTPTNPLLLNVPEDYFDADCKVMVFGKETKDWEGSFPCDGGVCHLLKTYNDFYNEGACYHYGGQFWNGISAFKRAFEERIKPSGKKIHILWNNVIKIGRAYEKGEPPAAIMEWQGRWFDVVQFEVQEFKPTVVVFFSGPAYDHYIRRIFPGSTFQAIGNRPARQLARVNAPGLLPSESAIRTYHPNFLWRNGFRTYLAEILAAVRI